jgi:hypothetical protein
MTVAGRSPLLNSRISLAVSAAGRPPMGGTAAPLEAAAGAWQPEHDEAPGGASAADAATGNIARASADASRRSTQAPFFSS